MTTIDQAYINALLADATYALDDSVERGTTGNELEEFLNERMTPTQAEYIGNNFTVIDHVESNDLYDSGFDATVWRSEEGQVYVSMQGTKGLADFGVDIDLTLSGLARDQIVDMVNWWLKIVLH